jgi:hypothetical protein
MKTSEQIVEQESGQTRSNVGQASRRSDERISAGGFPFKRFFANGVANGRADGTPDLRSSARSVPEGGSSLPLLNRGKRAAVPSSAGRRADAPRIAAKRVAASKTLRPLAVASLAAMLVVTCGARAWALNVIVDARCNIYGAGHSPPDDAPSVGSNGGGIAPVEISLTDLGNPPEVIIRAEGAISMCSSCGSNGPDGDGRTGNNPSYNGISGATNVPGRSLRAVFTSDSEPANPAPLVLDFALIGTNYNTLAPELNQMFFIGNGLAEPGAAQVIQVPANATELYLGFVDGNGYSDTPDWYADNSGSLAVSVSAALSLRIDFAAGQPGIRVYGGQGSTNRIEYTTVLPATEWTPLTNVVLSTVPTLLYDATFSGDAARFYRASPLP